MERSVILTEQEVGWAQSQTRQVGKEKNFCLCQELIHDALIIQHIA
jgi:hypothetical protein